MSQYTISSDTVTTAFSRLLGGTKVTETDTEIVLTKFPGLQVAQAITKLWKTSSVVKHMFNNIGNFRLSFYKFYAVEVEYVFNRLLKEGRLPLGTRGFIREALNQMKENSWLANTEHEFPPRLNYKHLNKFKKDPMPSQKEFMAMYDSMKQRYAMNGYLLFGEPGTGKTLLSLFISECLEKDLTIIICPKIALDDPWIKTLENEFFETPTYWYSGSSKPLDSLNYRYIVVHYEAISKLFPFIKELAKKDINIVLDECHNFNDPKSDRTQNYIRLCQETGCEDILPGSGTPVKAMANEMSVILKSFDPLFTDAVEERFKKIFGVSKARANDIMCHRMGIITHKIEKSSVVQNEKSEIEYKVSFQGSEKYTLPELKKEMVDFITSQLRYYADNKNLFEGQYQHGLDVFKKTLKSNDDFKNFAEYMADIKKIQSTLDYSSVGDVIARANRYEKKVIHPTLSGKTLHEFKDAKSVVKYVSLKVRGEALGRILGKRRSECHVEMIKHAQLEVFVEDAVKKTLIFTSYVDVVKGITEYFKGLDTKKRYAPLPVYTETSSELKKMTHRFEHEEKANPMIATYQTLSSAVPLTMASTAIFFNQPFRSYEKEQASSRIDRKGQDAPLTMVNIILDTGDVPNISTRSMDIMQWSKEQVEQITGIKTGKTEIGVESSDKPIEVKAVIIKGNPDFIKENSLAEKYYEDIKKYMLANGATSVIFNEGREKTSPPAADVYVGHSRGVSRYDYMDKEDQEKFVRLGTLDGVINPDDKKWQQKQKGKWDGSFPPDDHYVFSSAQKSAIKKQITKAIKAKQRENTNKNISVESIDSYDYDDQRIAFLDEYDLGISDISAVIVKDDSPHSKRNQFADRYYNDIAAQLKNEGVEVIVITDKDPNNLPQNADIYIGCGAGNEAYGMLDVDQQQNFVMLNSLNGINHPDMDAWLIKQNEKPDLSPVPRGHYVLTGEQKVAIKTVVTMARDKRFGLEYFEMEQDIHHQYNVLSSQVASIESFTDKELASLTPGMEGLFDGAKRLVDKIFGVNIDKGKVTPYASAWRVSRTIGKMDYADLADIIVMRPEGMKVTYVAYAGHMKKQFESLNEFLSVALDSCSTYLAKLASDPGQIGSISSGEFNIYLKQYNLNQKKKEYASLFDSSKTVNAPYHEVVANNGDWKKIDGAIADAHLQYNKISPTEVEEKVDRIYDILEDILEKLKTDREAVKLSKVQIKDLSLMAYSVASVIEFYSLLMFGWTTYNQSLKETETTLSAWTPSQEGLESFSDIIKNMKSLFDKKSKGPLLQEGAGGKEYREAVSKLKIIISKQYTNDAWLNKQKLKTGPIDASGWSKYLEAGGNLSDPLKNVEESLQTLNNMAKQWGKTLAPVSSKVFSVDSKVRKSFSSGISDEELATKVFAPAVKELSEIKKNFNLSSFPKQTKPFVGNEKVVVKNGELHQVTEPVKGTDKLPALDKAGIKKAAQLIIKLLDNSVEEASSAIGFLKWLSDDDGSALNSKMEELDFYDDYYKDFTYNTMLVYYVLPVLDGFDRRKTALALERYITSSLT